MDASLTSVKARRASDAVSGMALESDHEVYDSFTQPELEAHFSRFKQYDVDNSGFITPENLKEIFDALGMPEVSVEHCANMLEEVALLIDHENDGKLSFRDYCHLLKYEGEKHVAVEAVEAKQELCDSPREDADAEPTGDQEVQMEPVAAAETRMRGSSFAVLDKIALSRIARFEQVVADAAAEQQASTFEVLKQTKFAGKLAKFKSIESGQAAVPAVNHESIHMTTLKAKLNAFELAARKEEPVAFTTSWKNVRQGTWKAKKQIAGGVAPKKSLADLP